MTHTVALNEFLLSPIIQNPPIPPLVKGGQEGFVQGLAFPGVRPEVSKGKRRFLRDQRM